ncbi:helix-turn-helix domain-containing protein [Streptomyces caatingaensis]|uniref:XRE family transcriptional regulator n=1 Tax=Streptomyces caatingaensis TaxID=1678637 RepID=A0A0K9X8X5_9ACTN|nr:helix-turn-helix transcriptional regulator [Streptomyces caatingaensis]KNB49879.1 XRE family transcriptional regulator [Streptomyces caatingaensis]
MSEQPRRFGQELRKRRLTAGMTLEALAGRVHFSKGHLSKVERGHKPPSPELARLCDAVLGARGELAALAPGHRPAGPSVPPEIQESEVWSMHLSAGGQSWFQPVSRRQVVTGAAASAVALGLGAAQPPVGAEGSALLDIATSLFDQYRRLGQTAGPGVVLPSLIAQTHTLRDLASRTGPAERRRILRLASRYAEYIGWLVQESGNDSAALWWTRQAVAMAAAGGDPDLAAYAYVRRALITLYRQDAAQTVELARQAQDGRLPPRIRGLAAQREAQGHALAGAHDSCMRALDRARALLALDPADSAGPVIGTTNLADPVGMVTGWCLHDLGRPRQAAAVIDEQLRRVPGHALRTRARYGARCALAHAAAGDIDQACDVARQLIGPATTVDSATIATDLRRLERTLARHPRSASVRALAPDLAAALPAVPTH